MQIDTVFDLGDQLCKIGSSECLGVATSFQATVTMNGVNQHYQVYIIGGGTEGWHDIASLARWTAPAKSVPLQAAHPIPFGTMVYDRWDPKTELGRLFAYDTSTNGDRWAYTAKVTVGGSIIINRRKVRFLCW